MSSAQLQSHANSCGSPSRTAKLREARFADYPQIEDLQSRYALEPRSYEEWTQLWIGNPVVRDLRPDWTIGWVLEDAAGRIVGSIDNIPLWYQLGGRTVLTATARAWVSEPEYRSASLLLLDRVINQPSVELYFNTTPSPSSVQPLTFFECPQVPLGVWNQTAFWITNYGAFWEGALPERIPRWARKLSRPASGLVFLRDKLLGQTLRQGDVEVQSSTSFDERFDDFWSQLEHRNPHVLLALRTREILDWHFQYARKRDQLLIATIADANQIAAYAIFIRSDNLKRGLKRLTLVDFQSLEHGTDLLRPILAWAIGHCCREGVHMLEHFGRWLEPGEFMQIYAPYTRYLPNWSYFYRANNDLLAEQLRDPKAWAPSRYDGDATL